MTSLRARPLLPFLLLVLGAMLALSAAPTKALAGGDDFEYGQALAKMGAKTGDKAYFEFARHIFNHVINDSNRSETDKDLCRYGLAEMKRNEAIGATGNMVVPYADVLALFEDAVSTMESFVKKNPEHAKTAEAQLQVGTTRLAFVQWARDNLLADHKYGVARNAEPSQVQKDAERMVRGAIQYFDVLREGHDANDADDSKLVSQYYWVLCQYYLALVYETGSDDSTRALKAAAGHLEDFVTLNDGQLLAFYAQDIYGLTRWEQAKAAEDEADKEKFYRRAVDWFSTCIDAEVYSPAWEAIIANGYLHIGQCCREAGRVGKTNFTKMGVSFLKDMEERFPTVSQKQSNCIRAMIEWAYLEFEQEHGPEAVAIAQRAGTYAKALGSGWLENQANGALKDFLGGRRGGVSSAEPEVLMRVADRFFAEKKWSEAIGTYQLVIGAADPTTLSEQKIETIVIRSWERVSAAYKEQGDLMAAAIALGPIHDIWMDGLVKKVGGPDDANMIRLGNIRLRARKYWKEMHDLTGSEVYRKRFLQNRDSFTRDYPAHPTGMATEWNAAREKFDEAVKQLQAKDSRYRQTFAEAEPLFRTVAKDMKSEKLDEALVKLIYIKYLMQDWKGMLREGKAAFDFWDSKQAKDQEKKFPTTAARRKVQRGRAVVWQAEAQYRLEQWDDVLKTLEGWRPEYGDIVDRSGRVDFKSRALGHLTQAWVNKGNIEKANVFYRRLVKEDPGYSRLSKISFALAEHFNKQARAIDKERTLARGQLNSSMVKNKLVPGARSKYRTVDRDLGRAQDRLGDVTNARRKAQRAIDLLAELKKSGDPVPVELPGQVEAAKKKIPELDAEIKRLTEKVNRFGAEMESLEKQVTELTAKIKDLAQKLYDPLVEAAGYYWDWDQALKKAEQPREAPNVAIFSDLYYKAGLLRPEINTNFARARSLYEDYLTLPDAAEETKLEALGRLGAIYSALAENAEEGSEAYTQLIQKALSRLQGSLAFVSENNELVVGHLKGDVVIIALKPRGAAEKHWYPLPKVKDVAEFKRVISAMGTPSGPKMPVFKKDVDNKRFLQDLEKFKQQVKSEPAANLKRIVKGFEKAGFDLNFFRKHAQSSVRFRLALAWIYSKSGEFEHMIKAVNLASSLVGRRHAAEELSEDWWAAQVIRLDALVTGSELQAKSSPATAPSPITKEWTDRASKWLLNLSTTSPDLGDDVRPETRPQLKALLKRIDQLRDRSGMKPINVNLVKMDQGGDGK